MIIGREHEYRLLETFLTLDPKTLAQCVVVNGYRAQGKSHTLRQFLSTLEGVTVVSEPCDLAIKIRFVCQRLLRQVNGNIAQNCDTVATFIGLFRQATKDLPHVIIVLERLDQCIEDPESYYSGFAKLREFLPNVSVVMEVQLPPWALASIAEAVNIHFPTYSEEMVVAILQSIPDIVKTPNQHYNTFIEYIVYYYYAITGSDVELLISIARHLWPKIDFANIDLNNTFLRWIRDHALLFEKMGVVDDNVVIEYGTFEEEIPTEGSDNIDDLPLYSKFILIALFLALYIDPKNDLIFFSRHNVKKNKRLSRRGNENVLQTRVQQANFFDLERMIAILSTIFRLYLSSKDELADTYNVYDDIEHRDRERLLEIESFTLAANIDLNNQLATLLSLGLLVKSQNSDILGAKVRWRTSLDFPKALKLAADVEFDLGEYFPNA